MTKTMIAPLLMTLSRVCTHDEYGGALQIFSEIQCSGEDYSPLFACSWELWPWVWCHENLLVRKPGPKWFSHIKHLFASKNIHLKVCLPKHLPGSSWKQEWLLANLATGPRPATAITGCSSTVGVAGPVGRERVWRGSFCPHCLPYSPTLAGCLTILTSLPSLPDCAAPPPGRAARGRRATFSEVEPACQSQVTNFTKGKWRTFIF